MKYAKEILKIQVVKINNPQSVILKPFSELLHQDENSNIHTKDLDIQNIEQNLPYWERIAVGSITANKAWEWERKLMTSEELHD